jgi:hypothetical protein
VYRKIGTETILVPIKKAIQKLHSIYTLNDVACRIWLLIDGRNTLDKIISNLLCEYEVDKEILLKDVERYIGQLESIGAIEK